MENGYYRRSSPESEGYKDMEIVNHVQKPLVGGFSPGALVSTQSMLGNMVVHKL